MPRKPKLEKQTITVIVNGVPVGVTLHPPSGTRKSWYAYWAGLIASKSTGQRKLEDAIVVAENMIKSGGKRADVRDAALSDEEFEAIQCAHFAKKTDPAAKLRADKTLEDCLDAISAFKAITGLAPITRATPDDCEKFQQQALNLPRNWRQQPEDADAPCLSPNTVLKWSRQLQAAFERANCNATRRKCVRGVVGQRKLLTANPWNQFSWISGTKRPIRQFDSEELLSLLSYFETRWPRVTVAAAAARVFLWSGCRKLEVAGLTWGSLREIGDEIHFQIVGKWGVERWFRVPRAVYDQLVATRSSSPFVFAAYTEQIQKMHADNPNWLKNVQAEFTPKNFGRWFYLRVKDWAASRSGPVAFVHHFRKTTLQYARRGEDINREVAGDARVSETVLMANYVRETDEEMRQKSNRTFRRIIASLPLAVARQYGHVDSNHAILRQEVQAAVAAENWGLVAKLTAELAGQPRRRAAGA
jgi:integrase